VVVIAGVGTVVAINQSGDDSPAAAVPVTIETEVEFGPRPNVGTFEVTVGADVLGCSNGTSVDTYDGATVATIKVMTCTNGGTGTFTIRLEMDVAYDENGPWSISDGSADFAGLQGDGDYLMVTGGATPVGFETITGHIEYTS
jgi:hypothetical protein